MIPREGTETSNATPNAAPRPPRLKVRGLYERGLGLVNATGGQALTRASRAVLRFRSRSAAIMIGRQMAVIAGTGRRTSCRDGDAIPQLDPRRPTSMAAPAFVSQTPPPRLSDRPARNQGCLIR
jgi:hypothetical protein